MYRELVPALKQEDIYRDGGRQSLESYESYKSTETVMGEEEGRRTMEEIYGYDYFGGTFVRH
jgi:hypothetical protein